MTVLIIDTATERSSVALDRGGKIHEEMLGSGFSNVALLPSIKKLCRETEVDPASFAYVVVGRGPGSYTGIRVGVAVAKAIALASHTPLVGVSSLRAFVPEEKGRFLALIDAKVGGMYGIEGHVSQGGSVEFFEQERLFSVEEVQQRCQGCDAIVTPSWAPIAARCCLPPSVRIIERAPSSRMLAMLGAAAFMRGEYTMHGDLPLLYLRESQAEIEKKKMRGGCL